MWDLLYKSPIFATTMYVALIIVTIIYVVFKYRNKRLFTIYNINIYLTLFIYIIITPFHFVNQAWWTLGYYNAEYFYPYLYKSISINFIGIIIFLISNMYFESKKIKSAFFNNVIMQIEHHCIYNVMCIIFVIFSVIYVYIAYKYNDGFALFNGGRMFYYDKGILSYVYQAVTMIINIFGLYFGLYSVNNHKSILLFSFAAFLSISSGSRGSFFLNIVYPLIIVLLYKKSKKITFFMIIRIVICFLILISAALLIGFIRDGGSNMSNFNLINSLLYGSTFSDIRDGAYLFYGYENNFNSKLVLGKTYLAGLLSFIPSYISAFRVEWTWGRFSTVKLFNGLWQTHGGFRGGDSFEAYVNFRIIGVIIASILRGYIFSYVERLFSNYIYDKLKNNAKINVYSIFPMMFLNYIQGFFTMSGSATSIYVYIAFMVIIYSAYFMLPKKQLKVANNIKYNYIK